MMGCMIKLGELGGREILTTCKDYYLSFSIGSILIVALLITGYYFYKGTVLTGRKDGK